MVMITTHGLARSWRELPTVVGDKEAVIFRATTAKSIDEGRTTLFWQDAWMNVKPIALIAAWAFLTPMSNAAEKNCC